MSELAERFETHDPGEKQVAEKIRCDACPVMCYIADGRTGACDRYGNIGGRIVRMDPLTILDHAAETGGAVVPFTAEGEEWDGELVNTGRRFVTAIGAGTTYPDYKPAPFIVSQEVEGVDLVTVVTEGIFSYCGVKVKIDTDRHLGPETAIVRAQGEAIGHVTTGEYGSQMLSLGGVHHLTGGSKAEGRATCDAMLNLCNRKPVELTIDGGATIIVEAGKPPVIDGKPNTACASAAARPPSACSPRNGAAWSTRWWWSTTTSPASSRSIRPARCWAGRTPASRSSAAARRRAAISRSPSPASAGAAPRFPTRCRSSANGTPRRARAPACRC